MKVAGIIAEYNPFHNGHAYHIAETRRLTGADYIVVAMSGDFVQRGEPAILDKYARARMALQNGADLVIELPTAYACGSAEYFATGAIRTLQSLGVVDVISFGCETQDVTLLTQLAKLYQAEPDEYSTALQTFLRQGLTYPQARAAATEQYLAENGTLPSDMTSEQFHALLASPNTILGIEYIKAILKYHAAMETVLIPRYGNYHSLDLETSYASATAIRALLTENKPICQTPSALKMLAHQVPADAYGQISTRRDHMCADDFSGALGYALLAARNGNLTQYVDMSPDLADRILSHLTEYTGWSVFVDQIKTKQMTRSRISRALLHLLLQIRSEQMNTWRQDDFVYYARALGFHKRAAYLLGAIKKNSTVPMLTKLADAKDVLYTYYKERDRDKISHAYRLLDTD
ncbi:MAG: nucleotidyltransferase family protein, partial [Lachnospiraceae bacterium]|nr:nucleotidyltransferase family protein [Lachnospiraceae bacterium]